MAKAILPRSKRTLEEKRRAHCEATRKWMAENKQRILEQIAADPELQEKRRLATNAKAKRWYYANKEKSLAATRRWAKKNPEKYRATGRNSLAKARLRNPHFVILENLRQNAKRRRLQFNITETDIVWPTHCPVFGFELIYFAPGGRVDASASVDRIDNALGYIKGNVMVISWKANRLKSNATLDDFVKIVEYMQGDKNAKNT